MTFDRVQTKNRNNERIAQPAGHDRGLRAYSFAQALQAVWIENHIGVDLHEEWRGNAGNLRR